MAKFGLIGKDIGYSFSKSYFTSKFEAENLAHTYENFDIESIDKFQSICTKQSQIKGLNVTIPYKEAIIPYLDKLSKKAAAIGAVNTIKISKKGKLIGYNTDYYGFKKSISPFLKPNHKTALILGTGGASKGVAFALKTLGIEYKFVSRSTSNENMYSYNNLTKEIIKSHQIIINCTPLGTHPNTNDCPNIPYDFITINHLLYDLIYNPAETKFLSKGRDKGATTCNGLKMLEYQAEKAWRHWN